MTHPKAWTFSFRRNQNVTHEEDEQYNHFASIFYIILAGQKFSSNLWIKLVPRLFFFCLTPFIAPFTFRHDPWLDTREFSRCLSGLGWQISFALRGNKSSHGKSNKLSFRFWFSAVFRDFLHHSVQGYVTHQTFPPLFLVARVQDLCLEGCEVFSVWNWHF